MSPQAVDLDTRRPSVLHAGTWGKFAGQCGSPGASNGPVDKATFDHPKGMCLTSRGQLVIVDSMNSCIRSIDLELGMPSDPFRNSLVEHVEPLTSQRHLLSTDCN